MYLCIYNSLPGSISISAPSSFRVKVNSPSYIKKEKMLVALAANISEINMYNTKHDIQLYMSVKGNVFTFEQFRYFPKN